MKKEILIIHRAIYRNSPQSIRFRNLMEQWSAGNNITLFTKGNQSLVAIPGIDVCLSEYSFLGKKLIRPGLEHIYHNSINFDDARCRKRDLFKRIGKSIKFRKLFFPDIYIIEMGRTWRDLKRLLSAKRFDLIIISALPGSFLLFGKKIKDHGITAAIVYDTGDPFYLNASPSSIGLIHRLFSKNFESKYLQFIDYLVVPNKSMLSHYKTYFRKSLAGKPVLEIVQGYKKIEKEIFGKQNTSKPEFVFMYAGRFYQKLREPFNLYNAFRKIKGGNIHLKIYGNIPGFFKHTFSDERIQYPGDKPYEDVLNLYHDSDAIVFIDNSSGYQVPGKIFEVLAAKKPVLFIHSNENSPTLEYVKDIKSVVLCKNDEKSIRAGLEFIIDNGKLFQFDYDSEKYCWQNLARSYLDQIFEPE